MFDTPWRVGFGEGVSPSYRKGSGQGAVPLSRFFLNLGSKWAIFIQFFCVRAKGDGIG